MTNVSFAATAEHLVGRHAEDLRNRFFWSRQDARDPPAGRGADGDAAPVGARTEIGPRSLAQIEGFLLAVMTRVLGHRTDLVEHLPGWLATACHAARDPALFRQGAAGFVRVAGRSHEHVCRATQQHLGLSPSAYMNGIRMEYAARLLAGSDDSIADIAHECGLENLSHFYRVFRSHHDMTPRAYRKRHQADIVQPR